MARRSWLFALGLAVTVACTAPAPSVVDGQVDAEGRPQPRDLASLDFTAGHGEEQPGVSLVPIFSLPTFVFGYAVPDASVQPGSTILGGTVKGSKRLEVGPLPGPSGTAAVHLKETSRTVDMWGALTTPAQRKIYARFAGDPSLGDYLVLVSDVSVTDGPDPVPVSAYRWPRSAVEAYAACGIPNPGIGIPWTEIDECTDTFFEESQIALVMPGATVRGQ